MRSVNLQLKVLTLQDLFLKRNPSTWSSGIYPPHLFHPPTHPFSVLRPRGCVSCLMRRCASACGCLTLCSPEQGSGSLKCRQTLGSSQSHSSEAETLQAHQLTPHQCIHFSDAHKCVYVICIVYVLIYTAVKVFLEPTGMFVRLVCVCVDRPPCFD